ncbi:MAG: phosphatidylserine decarboxylase, partial [Vicinamibacterales bacterium]
MRFDPAAWPFVGFALALGVVAGAAGVWALAALFFLLGGFFLFFFRDPDRLAPPGADDLVLSPADGRVLVA